MLSDVVKEFSCRNKDLRVQKVYSVTNSDGFMPSQDYFSKDVFSKDLSNYKIVRKGMLAYNPSRINIGSVACLQSEDEVIVSPLYVVVEVNEKKLLAEYLNLFLHSDIALEQIKSLTSGSVRDSLKYNAFTRLCLPIPTVEMQRAVIKKLNAIKKLIVKREQQLSKLDQLAKSRFSEMFANGDFPCQKLGTFCHVGSSKRVFVEELQSEGIPFFRGTEIGQLAAGKPVAPSLFITKSHYEALCSCSGKPQCGDLLLPSICSDGRIWCVNTDRPFYFKDGRVLWVKVPKSVNGCYLRFALSQSIIRNYNTLASGITFAELKIISLKEAPVPVPPLELQNGFAAFIEQLDKSKVTIRKSIEKLETTYRALLQEYFG